MSWTDFFPVLTDQHLEDYNSTASAPEKTEVESWFSHQRLGGPSRGGGLIALSLSPGIPSGSDGLLAPSKAASSGVVRDSLERPIFSQCLIRHILAAARSLALLEVDATIRIYLDPAWQEASEILLQGGCEVMLMNQASEGPNPAKMWRYLALEEDRPVTFLGIQDLASAEDYLSRVLLLSEIGLRLWRTPIDRPRGYRPISPDRFGSIRSFPAHKLLCAYLWHAVFQEAHAIANLLPSLDEPGKPVWEREDLDELFLMSAIYPRAAFDSLLSVIETGDQHSRWLILDIEYVTWASHGSEMVFLEYHRSPADKIFCDGFMAHAAFEKNLHPDL